MATIDKNVARKDVAGVRRRVVVQYNGPASYATGGDSLVAADVGFSKIEHVGAELISNGTTAFHVGYNYVTSKLIAYAPAAVPGPAVALAEVTATTNLSAFLTRLEVIGY